MELSLLEWLTKIVIIADSPSAGPSGRLIRGPSLTELEGSGCGRDVQYRVARP
jgi:hypothetical protein